MDKKGVMDAGILVLLAAMLLFFAVNGLLGLAETSEEEKSRLEVELADLEGQLAVIEGGRWVNYSCEVERIYYGNYNCDNLIGYHTVCISNISYYVSNCSSMPVEAVKIKVRIGEIKEQLEYLEGYR